MPSLPDFEAQISAKVATIASNDDPAHDILHFTRVVKIAKALCTQLNAQAEIVIPAAWLHDFVIVPKNDPRRSQASRLSAEAAIEYLRSIDYPTKYFEGIAHAIEAHSFSANIPTKSLEAEIVQDADRLDGLGAIGIARCFATAGLMRRAFYSDHDPFCELRAADDGIFTVDHFYAKLFKVAASLKTPAGQAEGAKRLQIMKAYLESLRSEIC